MKPKDESYWINVMTSNMSKYARIILLKPCKKLEKMTGGSPVTSVVGFYNTLFV